MSCCTAQTAASAIPGFPATTTLLLESPPIVFGEVYQGDDFNITLMVVDLNSVVVDLTGETFRLTLDWDCRNCRRSQTPLYAQELAGSTSGVINFLVPGFGASAYLNPWWGYHTPYSTLPCGLLRVEIKRWQTVSTILARNTVMTGSLVVLPSLTDHAVPLPV